MELLPLLVLLLSTSVLSSGLPSSDWYSYYAGDQAPAESPIYWSGGVGGSPKSGHWQQSYQGTIRRQDKDAPGADDSIFGTVRNGLADIGRHVVGGFTKLTGVSLPPVDAGNKNIHYNLDEELDGDEVEGQGYYDNQNYYLDGQPEAGRQPFFQTMKDNLLSFLKPKKPKRHLADYQVESYIGTNNINPGQQQYHYPDSLGRGKEPLTHSYEQQQQQPQQQPSGGLTQLVASSSATTSASSPPPVGAFPSGIFKIIPVASSDPNSPPLYQIVPSSISHQSVRSSLPADASSRRSQSISSSGLTDLLAVVWPHQGKRQHPYYTNFHVSPDDEWRYRTTA